LRSLSGEFSREVNGLVAQLIELRMLVEATLDFPEEEIDVIRDTDAAERLARFQAALDELRARARQGSVLRKGIHVVLAGLPNAGKSSLMNALAGVERAIVTDVAGTTRDVLRESILVEGVPLHIIDTAGLRESDDKVERIGIDRAWEEIGRADVVLQMVDSRGGLTAADHAIGVRLPTAAERIVVENKIDLAGLAPARFEEGGRVHLRLCAKSGEGVELLRCELLRVAGWQGGEDAVLARERHLLALAHASERSALAGRRLGQLELCAEELRLAQEALASITGAFSADDLLGEIFSRFCIGK
jgi:tRNA modification GTPase